MVIQNKIVKVKKERSEIINAYTYTYAYSLYNI